MSKPKFEFYRVCGRMLLKAKGELCYCVISWRQVNDSNRPCSVTCMSKVGPIEIDIPDEAEVRMYVYEED